MIAATALLSALLVLQAEGAVPAATAASPNSAPSTSGQQASQPQQPGQSEQSGQPGQSEQSEQSGPAEPSGPPLAPPPDPVPRRYGDAGTSEIAIGLGYTAGAGFLGAGGFRHFVVDAVAPGLEATYISGGSVFSTFGMVMGSLRLVPIRTGSFALVLTGRAGRVFLADHSAGWGAGGGAGVIVFLGANVGLELGYELLRLLPASFCADLETCVIQRPVVGLRLSF